MRKLFLLLMLFYGAPLTIAQPEIAGFSMSQQENLYWPRLKRGQSSSKVRVLQGLLNLKNAGLKVDGRFGLTTQNAVCSFQKSRKIKVDGVVGAQTWEKLTPLLQRGSRGEAVRIFRGLLARNGQRVKQDGIFGAATEKAVKSYQRKEGEGIMIASGRAEVWVWCWLLGGMNITD